MPLELRSVRLNRERRRIVGRDDQIKVTRVEKLDELGIDLLDFTDQSDVDRLRFAGLALQ